MNQNPSIINIKMPESIARLPVHRGYPVPWFVSWIDGVPEFRAADADKLELAVSKGLCWVCGEPLGNRKTFVIGPMCAVNRTSAEPPSHHACGVYSARACPFLSRPSMVRRDEGMPSLELCSPGMALARNPGVTVLWECASYRRFQVHNGRLFHIGDPLRVDVFAEGKRANRQQIMAAMKSGLPSLRRVAKTEGADAVRELNRMYDQAVALLTKC